MGTLGNKSIPHSLHECGYAGIAQAVTYLCCWDIEKETRVILARGEDPYKSKHSHEYLSAVCFLLRKENHLYLLDIPGEELVEKIIKEAIDDWKRKH